MLCLTAPDLPKCPGMEHAMKGKSQNIDSQVNDKRVLRVLIAESWLFGNESDTLAVARKFCDAGFEVIYLGYGQIPEQIVSAAIQEDVDAIGLNIVSRESGRSYLRVVELLEEESAENIIVTRDAFSNLEFFHNPQDGR